MNVKIQEGNNSRIQTFTGVVIARKGAGVRETFVVRKISFGTGVERRFPLHSPSIDSIKLVRKGRVRRAKLYYLRALRGKAARIAERATTPLSESIRGCNREPDDAGARINREIQPRNRFGFGLFSYFPRMMDGRRHPSYPAA